LGYYGLRSPFTEEIDSRSEHDSDGKQDAGGSEAAATRGDDAMRGRRHKIWLLLIPLVAAGLWFAWSAATYASTLRLYVVPSVSMSPTITPGDRVCVEPRRGNEPGRGEVWIFQMPNGQVFIKRVIGLPGESVQVSGGRVLIDGKPLAEPYVAAPMNYSLAPVRLEAGRYFVLGDNRNASNDSHLWGPVPRSQLLGRVQFRPWPPSRIGQLR
jgi:signal peptidase I